MIDQNRIEEIKSLPVTKAKAAMKAYGAEFGIVPKGKTIDNMVSDLGAQLANKEEQIVIEYKDEVVISQETPIKLEPDTSQRIKIDPRVKGVQILPGALNPIKGRGFMMYAKPTDIADVDKCTFQWSHKVAGGAAFENIVGATNQTYKVANTQDANLGDYKCKIIEPNGTETESTVSAHVATLATLPAGFPEHTLFKSTWIEFYGRSYAHVGWHSIYKMMKVLDDTNINDNPSSVHQEMAKHEAAVPLLDLISNTPELIATDSRDGYRHLITSDNDRDNKIKTFGRFINK
ncbi:MAG: hypothetical protein ACRC9Y_03210 [Aeromonas veronii]